VPHDVEVPAARGGRADHILGGAVALAAHDEVRQVLHLGRVAAAHLAAQLLDRDLHAGLLPAVRAVGARDGHHLGQRLRLVRPEARPFEVVERDHLGEALR